jgi:hypothetical protein
LKAEIAVILTMSKPGIIMRQARMSLERSILMAVDTDWFLEQASRAIIGSEQATMSKRDPEAFAYALTAFYTTSSVRIMVKTGLIALNDAQRSTYGHIINKLVRFSALLPEPVRLEVNEYHQELKPPTRDEGLLDQWKYDPLTEVYTRTDPANSAALWLVGQRVIDRDGWYWSSALRDPDSTILLQRTSSYFGPFSSWQAAAADCEVAHRS